VPDFNISNRIVKLFPLFLFLVLFGGCTKKKTIAFYYWKSDCRVEKNFKYPLYVKVLDINKKGIFKTACFREHIPVVYIENDIFKIDIDVDKIVKREVKSENIQFDCDWTLSTKERYFSFLKRMKKIYKRVSVTIRLHQLKYFSRTGVPPVDEGVLMLYNMSDFKDPYTRNYVLDLKETKKYFKNFKSYPLKLNVALPIYSTAFVIRYGEVVGLIDDVRKKDLDSSFFETLGKNRFRVMKTRYFKGKLLYEGDILRVDEVDLNMLKEAVETIPFTFDRVIFFRYGNLKNWNIEDLKKII